MDQTVEGVLAAIKDHANGTSSNGYHEPTDVDDGARATPLEQALEMHDLGYWPVLIHPDQKRPIGNEWGLAAVD